MGLKSNQARVQTPSNLQVNLFQYRWDCLNPSFSELPTHLHVDNVHRWCHSSAASTFTFRPQPSEQGLLRSRSRRLLRLFCVSGPTLAAPPNSLPLATGTLKIKLQNNGVRVSQKHAMPVSYTRMHSAQSPPPATNISIIIQPPSSDFGFGGRTSLETVERYIKVDPDATAVA